ncbi:DUF3618 domain-containing protein [Actinoplanes aureus]|jgi:hypothetical protein|uniref:DUF3618 domain-containing protein n=1 Tax=Actinoplanes aureus TaxID=2792083 RepID=A0A931CDU9_9ACTN|nr:DUF3618 domain-containing protein [Actinoplanes aureus]MBG0568299.1 DUF3618 domain-containing protein [Actinoplanes aureus]
MSGKNGSAAKPDLTALREEIRQTRADLGETVQALAARADVKARAREQVEQTKERVLTQAAAVTGRVREATLGATGRAKAAAVQATEGAPELAHDARARVRANPYPAVLVVAGVVAVVGVILIVRGRR